MKRTGVTPRRSGGFTLFEVMAAVLVLGLLYTMLANATMDGLRSEGINRRRGEASLLADRRLAELEATLSSGVPLPLGRSEEDEGPYHVTVDVEPIDVMALLPPDPDADPAAPKPDLESLLSVDSSGHSRVQQATVTVEWEEVDEPYRVVRNTFAFDTSGLEDIFPSGGEGADGSSGAGGAASDLPPEFEKLLEGQGGGAQ